MTLTYICGGHLQQLLWGAICSWLVWNQHNDYSSKPDTLWIGAQSNMVSIMLFEPHLQTIWVILMHARSITSKFDSIQNVAISGPVACIHIEVHHKYLHMSIPRQLRTFSHSLIWLSIAAGSSHMNDLVTYLHCYFIYQLLVVLALSLMQWQHYQASPTAINLFLTFSSPQRWYRQRRFRCPS